MKKLNPRPTVSKRLILLLWFFTIHTADAQIWKNTGKKIQKKLQNQADKRLERKLDKSIDKSFDKVEDSTEDAVKGNNKSKTNKGESNKANSMEQMLSSLQSDVSIPSSYQFYMGVNYNISITSKSGKKKENDMQTSIWFSKDGYVGMSTDQQKEMFMVLDADAMVTFMEKEKTYMAINTDVISSFAQSAIAESEDEDDEFDSSSFKKIGSEKILGYQCDIYLAETDDSKSKIWIAKDFNSEGGSLVKAFGMVNKGKNKNHFNA